MSNDRFGSSDASNPSKLVGPVDPKGPLADVRTLDLLREASLARFTAGLSPESLMLAWSDWALHLAGAPGKRLELALRMGQAVSALWGAAAAPGTSGASGASGTTSSGGANMAADPRFAAPAWQHEPYRAWAQAFLSCEAWWGQATRDVPGTVPHHEEVVSFMARQWLDMLAPSNQPWSNPEVVERTLAQGGMNFWRGAALLREDLQQKGGGQAMPDSGGFVVGRTLACTPGAVVMRNPLAELIQYRPTTGTVHAEPVLLVSAPIMKYYILDLSPHNSMVRWLVDRGHTVFCLSWHNVTEADRDVALDDYRRLGVMAALDTITQIVPRRKVHVLGYCLGGTLVAIAAAAMARARDDRLASITLLAAQTDFTEPGELQLFIDPAQVHMLDSVMWKRGYLGAEQMAGAFQMLRSNDLVWSRMVHEYLLGERAPQSDLMAWNADSTRLPQRMHSEYLHRLFLGNDLAAGRFMVQGHPIALQNVRRLPIFALGTERDHVAPWRSVYKIHYLAETEVTFVLTNGGHNAGIVSAPGHPHRHFRLLVKAVGDSCLGADEWQASAPVQEGSWWPTWQAWLVQHSGARRVAPPSLGVKGQASLGDAPGRYVMER